MLCPKCSTQVNEGSKFCPCCGYALNASGLGAPAIQDVSIENPVQPVHPNDSAFYQQPAAGYQPQPQPQPQAKKSKALAITLAAVSVIAVAAIVVVILLATGVFDKKDDNGKDKSGSSSNVTSTTDGNQNVDKDVPKVGEKLNAPHILPRKNITKVHYEVEINGKNHNVTIDITDPDEQFVYLENFEISGGYCDILYVKYNNKNWGYYSILDGNYYELSSDRVTDAEFKAAQTMIDLCGFGISTGENKSFDDSFVYEGTKQFSDIGEVHVYNCTFADAESTVYIDPATGLVVYIEDATMASEITYVEIGDRVTFNDFRDLCTII